MDPLSLSLLIGGGLQGIGSIFGAFSENEASNNNMLIALMNKRARDREREEGIRYADEIRDEQKLGATNAAGDRTYFKPGVGWVTEPGARTEELMDYFYGQELPERRAQFSRGAERSRTESDVADLYLDELLNVQRDNPADIEAILYEAGTRGVGEATNEAMESAMRSAIRGGSSNIGKIAGKINEAGTKQRGNVAKDAKLQALDYVDDKFNAKRGAASSLYNLFASRAGSDIGMSLDPSASESGANALLSQFSSLAQQGSGIGANAIGKQGGSLAPVAPNNGLANMFMSLGNTVSGVGDRLGAIGERNEMNDLLRSFISGGGEFNLGRGGIFDTIGSRTRLDAGAF